MSAMEALQRYAESQTPKRRKRRPPDPDNPPEATEQRALAQYLNLLGVLWTHVPSGGNRDAITGRHLKVQGAKRGVPDVLIFTPPPNIIGAVGAAIELKRRKGGAVSREQRAWLEELGKRGWAAEVCRGFDAARETLVMWGYEEARR